MDRFRYKREDQFVYQIVLPYQPKSQQSKNKEKYKQNIMDIATRNIDSIIETNDIEIEITWTSIEKEQLRSDIDNIIKPIIDALKGTAYNDDKQIRSLVVTYFDRNLQHTINCFVEDLKDTFYSNHNDVVLVTIYSDQKLQEKGGAEKVKKRFLEQKLGGVFPRASEKRQLTDSLISTKSIEMLEHSEPIGKFVNLQKKKYSIKNEQKGLYAFWYNNHDLKANRLNRTYQIAGPNGVLESVTWKWNLLNDRICLYVGKSNNIKKRISLHLLLGTAKLYAGNEMKLNKKTTSCQFRSGFEYLYMRCNDHVDLFTEMRDRVEFSYVEESDFVKRFYCEDYFIGKWKPWFNLDSER